MLWWVTLVTSCYGYHPDIRTYHVGKIRSTDHQVVIPVIVQITARHGMSKVTAHMRPSRFIAIVIWWETKSMLTRRFDKQSGIWIFDSPVLKIHMNKTRKFSKDKMNYQDVLRDTRFPDFRTGRCRAACRTYGSLRGEETPTPYQNLQLQGPYLDLPYFLKSPAF